MKEQLVAELRQQCSCDISVENIEEDAFGCGQHNHLITYRGRILGSDDYSALGLVELMQSWVSSSQAFITLDSFRMRVDQTCPAQLDTINAPDCPLIVSTTPSDELTTPPNLVTTPVEETTVEDASTTAAETKSTKEITEKITKTTSERTPQASSAGIQSGEVGGIVVGILIIILLLVLLTVIMVLAFFFKCRKGTNGKIILRYITW